MRNLKKPLAAAVLSAAALGASPVALAEIMDFTVVYSPIQDAPYTATGTAILKLTLDTNYIVTAPNTGANINVLPYVTNFSLTVTGANYGNGTYGISDYAALLFDTSGKLDYTKQLLGQNNFGPSTKAQFGTFDITANDNNSPTEATPMTILTAGNPQSDKFNEHMVVSSITAVKAVPEPSTYAMLLGGLGLIGFIARRRNGKV